jgi:flagellar motor switch protein FliN/FliY
MSSAHRRAERDAGAGPPERIGLFAQGFFEGAGPVLTTMMNRPVSVSVLAVEEVAPVELLRRVPLPWMLAELRYGRGLTGTHWMILNRPGALILGHALTGEQSDEALELLASHEEAIRETLNQILSTASTALMPLLARSLSFAPVTLQVVDDPAALPPELSTDPDRFWLIRAEAAGPEGFRAEFFLTLAAELAREISTVGIEPPAASGAAESREADHGSSGIELILDVTLPVAVELGRARMQIQDILKLAPGSIVELDKSAGDPVEILINDRPIAKGEVVVIDENFGVRLTSIVTATERIKTLR